MKNQNRLKHKKKKRPPSPTEIEHIVVGVENIETKFQNDLAKLLEKEDEDEVEEKELAVDKERKKAENSDEFFTTIPKEEDRDVGATRKTRRAKTFSPPKVVVKPPPWPGLLDFQGHGRASWQFARVKSDGGEEEGAGEEETRVRVQKLKDPAQKDDNPSAQPKYGLSLVYILNGNWTSEPKTLSCSIGHNNAGCDPIESISMRTRKPQGVTTQPMLVQGVQFTPNLQTLSWVNHRGGGSRLSKAHPTAEWNTQRKAWWRKVWVRQVGTRPSPPPHSLEIDH